MGKAAARRPLSRGVQQPLHVPPTVPARVAVLASGTGSLLRSLLDATAGEYPARIVAVGVDRHCPAVDIAAAAAVPSYAVRLRDYPDRDAWDAAITEATAAHEPDLIVAAGFMKILGPQFLSRFMRPRSSRPFGMALGSVVPDWRAGRPGEASSVVVGEGGDS